MDNAARQRSAFQSDFRGSYPGAEPAGPARLEGWRIDYPEPELRWVLPRQSVGTFVFPAVLPFGR